MHAVDSENVVRTNLIEGNCGKMAMPDWYTIAKDFVGPAATMIASITAARITYHFGSKQTEIARSQAATAAAAKEIAKSQRDIAYDKLKNDLFDKRYEIYLSAKQLIEMTSGDTFETIHDPRLREMRLKLDEARFFFRPKETGLFSTIENAAAEYLVDRVERDTTDDDQRARFEAAKRMTNTLKTLTQIYASLPALLENELGFQQLRSGTGSDKPDSRA